MRYNFLHNHLSLLYQPYTLYMIIINTVPSIYINESSDWSIESDRYTAFDSCFRISCVSLCWIMIDWLDKTWLERGRDETTNDDAYFCSWWYTLRICMIKMYIVKDNFDYGAHFFESQSFHKKRWSDRVEAKQFNERRKVRFWHIAVTLQLFALNLSAWCYTPQTMIIPLSCDFTQIKTMISIE